MKNRTQNGLLVIAAYLSLISALYFVIFTYSGTAALIVSTVVCAALFFITLKRAGRLAVVLTVIPLLLSVSCTFIDLKNRWQTNTEVESLYVGSMKRTFRYYHPAVIENSPRRAIIVLHGFMQTAATMERLTDFNDLAQQYGFLVIYPEGYRKSWNDGDDTKPATRENIDDVVFLSTIVDTLRARYAIDEIYLTGFSNGGFLAVDAACQLADEIDGFAAVAAGTWKGNLRHCSDQTETQAMFIQMKQDPLTKWQRFGASVEEYAKRIGCTEADTTQESNHQSIRYYCAPEKNLVHIVLSKGGHIWPGGPQYLPSFMIGSADVDFDASAFIVEELLRDDR